jgi:hypothetical protein
MLAARSDYSPFGQPHLSMKSSAKVKAVSEISHKHPRYTSMFVQLGRSRLLGNGTKIWQGFSRSLLVLLPATLFACTSPNIAQQPETAPSTEQVESAAIAKSSQAKSNQEEPYSLLIHRADKRLEVLNSQGKPVYQAPVGIGQGGLKEKQDMADLVTPTGQMTVDLILYKKSTYNQIVSQNVERFSKNPEFRPLVDQPQGLVQLFKNMNRIDFDGNGGPDKAYGDGYIGLTSETVITGPKMSKFEQTPYWFSIALHGTPDPKNIGQANSGGCVHLGSGTLQQLIENGWVRLGTVVKITD